MQEERMAARFRDLGHLVGNTPLLGVHFRFRGWERRIFAKAEHLSLTGSIKDRMALHILRRAYEVGALKPGAPWQRPPAATRASPSRPWQGRWATPCSSSCPTG